MKSKPWASEMKPTDKAHVWRFKNAADRVDTCIAMLSLHGFIKPAERRKIEARVQKWNRSATDKRYEAACEAVK